MALAPQRHYAQKPTLERFSQYLLPAGFWQDKANRRKYMDFLKNQLGGSYEDLYEVSTAAIEQTGGKALLKYNQDSPVLMVINELPEHKWKVWKFKKTKKHFWSMVAKNFRNGEESAVRIARDFIEDLATECGITSLDEWDDVVNNNAKTATQQLIQQANKTLKNPTVVKRLELFGGIEYLLKHAYPTHKWTFSATLQPVYVVENSLDQVTKDYWDSKENRQKYLDTLVKLVNGDFEKFYTNGLKIIIQSGGRGLLARYNNSPALLLMKEFPHHDWHPWRFNRSPRGWWRAIAQQFKENDPSAVEMVRKYINYLSEKYNIRTLNDWHFFAPTGSAAFHLATLGSLPEVLQRLYPDHDWHFDKPNVLSAHPAPLKLTEHLGETPEWHNPRYCRMFLDSIKDQLGGTYECLYSVSYSEIVRYGGSGLLWLFDTSVAAAISHVYPEYAWHRWKFSLSHSKPWWRTVHDCLKAGDPCAEAIVRDFIEDIAQARQLDPSSEWMRVGVSYITNAYSIIRQLGGLSSILQSLYPAIYKKSNNRKMATQLAVRTILAELFPMDAGNKRRRPKSTHKLSVHRKQR